MEVWNEELQPQIGAEGASPAFRGDGPLISPMKTSIHRC